jgi:glycosyltransferase involved in cell wall biosynthesis
MPIDFVKMHREFGAESNLITLYSNSVNFDEDICLNFKLPSGKNAKKWRDVKIEKNSPAILKYNSPKNILEKMYFNLRDEKNKGKIKEAVNKHKLFDYDVYHFDGGMDLFRDLRFAKELKKRNKKIVCCYYGSDLRTRGIFKELDEISDLNLTVEFDHLALHPKINYIYFPFDEKNFKISEKNNQKIKIIHSPTNREYKGTDKILKVISEVENSRNIEFILLENIEREKVLKIKSECDIAIDQVGGEFGGTGYGKNSIENLSMGVPTVTEFSGDYLNFIKENPFIHSDINSLKENLVKLIDNKSLRSELSVKGRKWVEDYHSYSSVNKMLMSYYEKFNII